MEPLSPLVAWDSFYVMVGSSGAALIGMQFVVMTLIADRAQIASGETISAFSTPTVVHLSGALLVSAIMSAPWPTLFEASVAIAVCGVVGLVYAAIVVGRTYRQKDYRPVWQDWLWYGVLPAVNYGSLVMMLVFLESHTTRALFAVAGASIGLLIIGIHNAWDSVTHITLNVPKAGAEPPPRTAS